MYSKTELLEMITAEGRDQRSLHEQASAVRDRLFGRSVILRGVIEVTNLCRVNCDYCPMRRDNTRLNSSYLLEAEAILEAAHGIRDAGIDVIGFQGGEVPQTTQLLLDILPDVRSLFEDRVEILLGLGVKPRHEYEALKARGANTYVLKHETSDRVLHEEIRHEPLETRIDAIRTLIQCGYRVGSGSIVGLPGQSVDSLADDILLAQSLGVHMCSASPFVPTKETPLSESQPGSVSRTLNVIAAMRLVNPSWLIPSVSALEQQSAGGQSAGVRAGANVITVNFTPPKRRDTYLIYGPTRHIVAMSSVTHQLQALGINTRGSAWLSSNAS